MLLKRIELLLDPRIIEIAFVVRYDDNKVEPYAYPTICDGVVKDGDRVQIYEGVEVSRRTLED